MNYIINKEQYLAAKAEWKSNKNRDAVDHIIYNAIRGFDIKRGFTGITNPTKLGNGAEEWAGFKNALNEARWQFREAASFVRGIDVEAAYQKRVATLSSKYGFEFTEELMEKMREVLK